jgi:exodeoxyribonuclease-3
MLRLVTWNVNSLKARLPRVQEWLTENAPDVVCLQETKMKDEAFPAEVFREMGYESAHHGQGQWNGVAILSKVGIDDVVAGWDDGGPEDGDARLIWATCGGVRVASAYVPNGRALDNDHYTYKLGWLERLRATLDRREDAGSPLAVCGDYNIAPEDRDVWDPAHFAGLTHTSEPERAALRSLEAWGMEDVYRRFHDEAGLFSWWDYRGGDFHQGRGMRIDLILATPSLARRATGSFVDRDARKGEKPSDHAPVVADFDE